MGKSPAFQFYAADFLIGTMDLSAEAVGVYIRLLAYSWDKGKLPESATSRAKLAGISARLFSRVWRELEPKWVLVDGGYINERLEEQRAEYQAFTAKQAANGRASAAARRVNGGSTVVEPPHRPNSNSSVFSLQSSKDLDQERGRTERAAPALSAPVQSLVDAWNIGTTPPLPKCLAITDKRIRAARQRIAERGIDEWRAVVARIEGSRFCRGENDRGWVATFDWLVQPDTAVKVLEGKYDNRAVVVPVRAGRGARTAHAFDLAAEMLEAQDAARGRS